VLVADNQAALAGLLIASIVGPLVVLAVVLGMMWRSSNRQGPDESPSSTARPPEAWIGAERD